MGYNENYIEPWCQYFVECHLPALIDQGSKVGTRSIWIAGRTHDYKIIILWHGFWLALDLTAQV